MVASSLQNLAIGGALIAISFVPFVVIRRIEAKMALHEPWIAGDLVLKAKIRAAAEVTCLPGFRPLPKKQAGRPQVATGDAVLDGLAHVLTDDPGLASAVADSASLRQAIARIYDLAPNATVRIRAGTVTCYVNDFNYRKRTPGFSLPAYKAELKSSVRALAELIDGVLQ